MIEDPTLPTLRRLEAERLRGTRDETVPDPMRDLIALLDRLLTNPGPPDRTAQDLSPKELPR